MEGTSRTLPQREEPTPVERRVTKARRTYGFDFDDIPASVLRKKIRRGLALPVAALVLSLAGLLTSAYWVTFAHGQRSESLTPEAATQISADSERPPGERNAAQVRVYEEIVALRRAIEVNKDEPGELGANARALLEKLKR